MLLIVVVLMLTGCGGGGAAESDNGGEQNEVQGVTVTPANVIEKGTLEYGQKVDDEITAADEVHRYQFTGASGDEITIRIGARGSAFTAPYIFLYAPNGDFIVSTDTSEASRSSRVNLTLEQDGTYTIAVQPVENRGIEAYELTVEKD